MLAHSAMLPSMPPHVSDPAVRTVSSRHHPLVARCRALAQGKDRSGLLLDGAHLLAEALAAGLSVEVAAFTDRAWTDPDAELARLRELAQHRGTEVVRVTRAVMDAMSPVRTSAGVVGIGARPQHAMHAAGDAIPLLLIVVDVQDPGNLGAIVRAAEAGGATGLIVTGASADPFSWKALRGSMGSALRLPIVVVPTLDEAIVAARGLGCQIFAAQPHHAPPFTEAPLTGPVALLLGGEGPGLAPEAAAAADAAITIPMHEPVESLNVAVAAALLVFEARRQRGARE